MRKNNFKFNLRPFTAEEFYERNEQSQKDIETKKLVSHAEVKRMFKIKSKTVWQTKSK